MNITTTSHNSTEQPKQYYYAIIYFSCFILLGLSMATLGPMLKQLSESVGVTIASISSLITIKAVGYFLGTLGSGRLLFDRFANHGHKILAYSVAGMAVILATIPFSTTLLILALQMFLLGLFEGVIDVGGNLFVMLVFKNNLSPYMNALHFSFGFGAFVSPLIIAGFLQQPNSLQWTYWVLAFLFVPTIIGLLKLSSPKYEPTEKTNRVKPTNYLILVLLTMLFFLYVGGELTFGNWVFTYSFESKLLTELQATYLTSVFWGSFAFARFLSIFLSRKIPSNQLLTINFVGAALSIWGIYIIRTDPLALWIGSITLGIFLASTYATLLVFAEKQFNVTGSLTSWFLGGSGAASMIIPFIMTNLYKVNDIFMIPLTLVFIMTLALVLFIVLSIITRTSIQKGL